MLGISAVVTGVILCFTDVFASLFEDLDLVASDLAAALVLLRLKRKYEEQREESFRKIDRHLPISRSSTASIGKFHDLFTFCHYRFLFNL